MSALSLLALLASAGPVQHDEPTVVYNAKHRFSITFPAGWKVVADYDNMAMGGLFNGEPIADATYGDDLHISVRTKPKPGLTTEKYARQENARLDALVPGYITATGKMRTGAGAAHTRVLGSVNFLEANLIKDSRLWTLSAYVPPKDYKSFVETVFQTVADSIRLNVDPPKGKNVVYSKYSSG